MDQVISYRKIVSDIIRDHAQDKPSHGQIETMDICDQSNDHFLLLHSGWQGEERVYGVVLHLDICDGKILVQYDGTEEGVLDGLVEAGVRQEDIVLDFIAPAVVTGG